MLNYTNNLFPFAPTGSETSCDYGYRNHMPLGLTHDHYIETA